MHKQLKEATRKTGIGEGGQRVAGLGWSVLEEMLKQSFGDLLEINQGSCFLVLLVRFFW